MWGNDMGALIVILFIILLFAVPLAAVAALISVVLYIKCDRSDEQKYAEVKKVMKYSVTAFIITLVVLGLILLLWGGDLAEM